MENDDKILLSLEPVDTVTGYPVPNSSSTTWYLKEENKISLPKVWGWWVLFNYENNNLSKLWEQDPSLLDNLSYPLKEDKRVVYKFAEELQGRKHIYIIHIRNPLFFIENRKIGFNCIGTTYRQDIINGKAKLVLFYPLEGSSGELAQDHENPDLWILDEWVKREGFHHKDVFYVTNNMIIDEIVRRNNYSYTGVPYLFFENIGDIYEGGINENLNLYEDNYLFLHYGKTIRYHRVLFTNELLKLGLLDKGKVSLNNFTYEDTEFYDLKKLTPLLLDSPLDGSSLKMDRSNQEHYDSTFISIISETLVGENTIFFSEKTFKTIAACHPFMIVGNKGSLAYLRKLGYRTFDRWINEDYDNEKDYKVRISKIIKELVRFSKLSREELLHIRNEMKEILHHNRQTLIERRIKSKQNGTTNYAGFVDFLKSIY